MVVGFLFCRIGQICANFFWWAVEVCYLLLFFRGFSWKDLSRLWDSDFYTNEIPALNRDQVMTLM